MAKLDDYEIIARQAPGQVVLGPVVLLALVLVPELRSLKGLASTGASSLVLGILLAYLARGPGARKEAALYKQWGGKPTTELLLHGNPGLNTETRLRYHRFLASPQGPGITLLDPVEQERDPQRARELAESAGDWLRRNTRDKKKYPRVRQELIAYGFARNLWGMKPVGLMLCIGSAVLEFAAIALMGRDLQGISMVAAAGIATLAFALVWAKAITPSWVRVHANAYARALLETCEASPTPAPKPPPARKKPSAPKKKKKPTDPTQ
jgi:hypothetical protein